MKLRVGCVLVVIDSISLSSLCGRTAILGHLWPFPTARTRWAERAFCSQRRRPATEVKVVALVLTTGNRPCLPPGASCRHALAACCDCCSVLEPASPQVERVKRAHSEGAAQSRPASSRTPTPILCTALFAPLCSSPHCAASPRHAADGN